MLIEKIDQLYSSVISDKTQTYNGTQNKNEFTDCIEHLDACLNKIPDKDIYFLEIGAYKGLWALAFKILCEKHNKTPHYNTVTMINHDPHNQDLFKSERYYQSQGDFFKLIDADSTKKETLHRVTEISPEYHFVFIDGDHSFQSVMKDIKYYGPLAKHRLFFHDIHTKSAGVTKAINKSGIKLHVCVSYGDIMGIGIHNCKVSPLKKKKKFLGLF